MAKQRVEQRRKELREQLNGYMNKRKPQIEEKRKAVAENGALRAATAEEREGHARHATVAEGVFLERTVGPDDKAPVNFLEIGTRAARAVCRVVDSSSSALGTGFLIAPGLIITNNHVLADETEAEDALAEFQFELDGDEKPLRPARFRLQPNRLFATSPKDKFDFTIVAVSLVGEGNESLEAFGWLPLDERPNKILDGQPVVVIQHPNGNMKAVCLFDSVCVFRDNAPDSPFLLYTTDTEPGSSGSPAFNRFWQVIALHHASAPTGKIKAGEPEIMNRGIRVSSIFKALAAGPVPGVLKGSAAHIRAIHDLLMHPRIQRNGRPFAPTTPAPEDITTEAAKKKPSGTVIRRKHPAHFDNRAGFDPMFLTATPGAAPKPSDPLFLPLPKLPEWMLGDVARLRGSNKYELKYQHFSIIMSASRSLALLTACNVDGASMFKLGRTDRDPDHPLDLDVEPEAAADVWFYDPRLDERQQLGPEVYDRTSFDYGHLVRRLDPVWGSDKRTPRIANDDTFCMTNCSPQETRFHRTRKDGDGNWSALEDVILNEANLKDQKFVILTGPVLDPRDPTILGVKIPTAFWKIAAYAEDGKLKAHGFLLWQEEEVAELDEKFEGLIDLSRAKRPVRIREIARLTGLDFGPLFTADVRR